MSKRRSAVSGLGNCRSGEADAEDILHVVQARRLVLHPFGRTDRSFGESRPAGGHVLDLDALTFAAEKHGVIPDDISTAQDLHADLLARALAGVALAAGDQVFGKITARAGAEDLGQA